MSEPVPASCHRPVAACCSIRHAAQGRVSEEGWSYPSETRWSCLPRRPYCWSLRHAVPCPRSTALHRSCVRWSWCRERASSRSRNRWSWSRPRLQDCYPSRPWLSLRPLKDSGLAPMAVPNPAQALRSTAFLALQSSGIDKAVACPYVSFVCGLYHPAPSDRPTIPGPRCHCERAVRCAESDALRNRGRIMRYTGSSAGPCEGRAADVIRSGTRTTWTLQGALAVTLDAA